MVIALCLAVLIGCAPSFQAFAHDQVLLATTTAERHMALEDPVLGDHGNSHTHDDGEPDEQRPGHSHGHNPADHTHDTGQAAALLSGLSPAPKTSQQFNLADDWKSGLPNRLDRPPRALS